MLIDHLRPVEEMDRVLIDIGISVLAMMIRFSF